MLKIDPTQRFSSRVESYRRGRPSYPQEILPVLEHDCGLSSTSVVADVASGTGIFTRLLLANGNRVFAVEPNRAMRSAAEEYLAPYPNFVSIEGTAEATTLRSHSVDLVTCAQAAHWFDREKALCEFQRILTANGFLVLIWNERRIAGSAFGTEYEQLVTEYGIDYDRVRERGRTTEGSKFFGRHSSIERKLDNYQNLDYPALVERLLSSSYVPQQGDERCAPMLAKLRQVFERHQQGGRIRMEYDTKLYLARLPEDGSSPALNRRGLDL